MPKQSKTIYGVSLIATILGIVEMLSEVAHTLSAAPPGSYMSIVAPWVSGVLWSVLLCVGWREFIKNPGQYSIWVIVGTSLIGIASIVLTLYVTIAYATKAAHMLNAVIWLVLVIISFKEISPPTKQGKTP